LIQTPNGSARGGNKRLLVGNGAEQAFEDAQATEPAAFYRIVRVN
jgi:hypothetical protein